MKNVIKSIALATIAISAVALTGCSKKGEVPAPVGELVEILPTAGSSEGVVVESAPVSRTVINPSHGSDLAVAFARLDQVSETDASYPAYSTVTAPLTATWAKSFTATGATAITFETPQYYLTRTTNNNTKLVGWYPHLAANTLTSGVVAIAVDGSNDIMLTQELEGNKSGNADMFGATGKIFNFKHLLSQLKFSAYAKDQAGKDAYGKLQSIALKEQLATCSIALPGANTSDIAFAYASADPKDMKVINNKVSDDSAIATPLELDIATVSGGSVTAKNDKEFGYALIAPVAFGTITLEITTEVGKTISQTLNVPAAGFEAGKAYNIVLCFTAAGIEPTATITDWVSAGSDVEITM